MRVDIGLKAKKNETIQQHTDKVVKVASLIMNHMDSEIDKLTKDIEAEFFQEPQASLTVKKNEVIAFIKEMVEYHDYGKVNKNFQEHINGKSSVGKEIRQHSIFSFYIWLSKQLIDIVYTKDILCIRAHLAYSIIAGHHGHLKEARESRLVEKNGNDFDSDMASLLEWEVLEKVDEKGNNELEALKKFRKVFKKYSFEFDSTVMLTFAKTAYSILILADSVASSEIEEDEYKAAVYHLMCKDIKETSFHNKFQGSILMRNVTSSSILSDDCFSDCQSMGDVRVLLNKKSSESWEEGTDIYILEAPVGTGKTMSSLALADKLLEKEGKRKIISVFPLNSVQTQYVEMMKNDLNLDANTMNVINSNSLFGLEDGGADEKEFEMTTTNLWLFERNCFSNELLITSHVQFFNVLTGLKRNSSLGFLNLRKSIVIIDEFQNYPKDYWFEIWGELLSLSKWFGIKWIFTSGTFPVSQKQLNKTFGTRIKKVLNEEENKQLFGSPFVKDRCTMYSLNNQIYEGVKEVGIDIAENILLQEKKGHSQFIVCSSFVKNAKVLHESISVLLPEYKCYFLCGRHSSSYKKELIKQIFLHNKHREDKIILVTTKTVECGMDFDFDIGYKEFDMFDSVEQLSGRINRSKYRTNGEVITFQLRRRKFGNEKYYTYDENVVEKLKNKRFIELYEEMYKQNKVSLARSLKEREKIHQKCSFEMYESKMTIIKENEYNTEIMWVFAEQEDEIKELIGSHQQATSYADKVIESMRLRIALEPYCMNVTVKWLNKHESDIFRKEKMNSIYYYVVCNEERFEENVDVYELSGIRSYVEKDVNIKIMLL